MSAKLKSKLKFTSKTIHIVNFYKLTYGLNFIHIDSNTEKVKRSWPDKVKVINDGQHNTCILKSMMKLEIGMSRFLGLIRV